MSFGKTQIPPDNKQITITNAKMISVKSRTQNGNDQIEADYATMTVTGTQMKVANSQMKTDKGQMKVDTIRKGPDWSKLKVKNA